MRTLARFLLVLALVLAGLATVTPRTAAAQSPRGLAEVSELEAFLDGQMRARMEAEHVAGALVVVVKDGEVMLAKGYGYADLEQAAPVDPATTLFRPGSISKLFTWTAVMQQVEQGRLDLDADINTYLGDLQIPATFVEPIRLRDIMTHTPGFEDVGRGLFVKDSAPILSLEDYLRQYMPARVYPPGEVTAYSNYATALAGYIVGRVSGVPFEQYVRDNILEPLGMASSTFQQPLPSELAGQMSEGYRYLGGRYEPRWFEVVQATPAGGLSATGEDMARFMVALLQGGSYGGGTILQPETVQDMTELHFSVPPQEQGWGRGFAVQKVSGLHIAGHGGDTTYFHSSLSLLPEHTVGIYVSTNTDTGGAVAAPVVNAFLERHFLLAPALEPQPESYPLADGARFAGGYNLARANHTTVERLLTLFQRVEVVITERGTLKLVGPFGLEEVEWAQSEPLVFVPVGTDDPMVGPLVFKEDASGKVERLYVGGWALLRLPAYAAALASLPLVGLLLAVTASTLVIWPVGFLGNRDRRRRLGSQAGSGVWPTLARLVAWVQAALSLVALLGIFMLLSDLETVTFGVPPLMETLMKVPYLTTALLGVMLLFTVAVWWKGWWTLIGRLHYTFITLLAGVLVLWQAYWRILA